jgi:ribosome biogenesis GTPase / thiamine phosphate phosphatase
LRALIYKSTGSWYSAKTEDGQFILCRIKGKLKLDKGITTTNPIAVGDWVEIEREEKDENQAMIISVEKRRNYLVRSSPHSKYQKHIVASNLDQSILIATLREPKTSTGFIDRYLVSCEAYHIPAVIVWNKSDLWDESEWQYLEELRKEYAQIGYTVLTLSTYTGEGFSELERLLANKISLLTGHSGVGKSTILNVLFPNQVLATQEVSEWSGKGLHTTTFAEMYDLPFGGGLMDTPGIRELGIVDVNRSELSGYFPEMREALAGCRYNNCTHLQEPGCMIKQRLTEGVISTRRYESYMKIYDSITDKRY